MVMFEGGPLDTDLLHRGDWKRVHSLIVHLDGDGRYSVGWYQQSRDENREPTGVFVWHRTEGES